MINIVYRWTDGKDADFRKFYLDTEEYYSNIVGGLQNRLGFVPHNLSDSISDVVIAYADNIAVGCAGLRIYEEGIAEIKRVWVVPEYRGKHIATKLMDLVEARARHAGFRKVILQTRSIMKNAVNLYISRGYQRIENYPPYDQLEGAICFAKPIGRVDE